MDESALRTLLNKLDASRSSLHGRLHVFTFLVIVGLAFDLFVIIKEFWDDWKDFRYGQIHPYEIHLPKRPNAWLLVLGLLGTALIVIGVWGELYVDVKVGEVETNIRAANDALLGLIIQEAGEAKASAKVAADAARLANTEARHAQQTADAVVKQANDLSRQLLEAKTQLEAVDAKRAELEKSLINMAICNAPRVIGWWMYDRQTNTDPLRPFATHRAIIEYIQYDAEAGRAAGEIYGALHDANWDVDFPSPRNGIEDGVEVMGHDPAADALVAFLHSYFWQAKGRVPVTEKDVPPGGAVRIRVGLYPAVRYVSPPGDKVLRDALAGDKDRDKARNEAQKKRDEQVLSHMTPEQAKEYKARQEQWNQEMKALMEREASPCHPLTSPMSVLP